MQKILKNVFVILVIIGMIVFVRWGSVVEVQPRLDKEKSDEQIKTEILAPVTGGKPQAGMTPQVPEDKEEITVSESGNATFFDNKSSENTDFRSLSNEQKLALLIGYSREAIGDSSVYEVYQGTPNYIVVTDKNGSGGPLNQGISIKDNHDGSFEFYSVSSSANSVAEKNKNNSHWEKFSQADEQELVHQIDSDKSKLNSIIPKIDMSKSDEVFSYLPVT